MFVLINIPLSTGDQVVGGGEEIGAGTEVGAGAHAEPIGIEIGIRLGAEDGFTAVLVAVATKINCICWYVFEYVLDMFAPLGGVVSQTIIRLFGDLFYGLLFNIIRLISGLFRYETVPSIIGADSTHKIGFINRLCCARGSVTTDVHSNGYFNKGLLAIVVAVQEMGSSNGLFNGIY